MQRCAILVASTLILGASGCGFGGAGSAVTLGSGTSGVPGPGAPAAPAGGGGSGGTSGSGGSSPATGSVGAGASVAVSFASVQPILAAHCTSCHAPGGVEAGSPLDTYAAVLGGQTIYNYTPASYVSPKNVAASLLVAKLVGAAGSGAMMPPAGTTPLTASELQVIESWIAQGAVLDLSGIPSELTLVSGDQQVGAQGVALPLPLVVAVTDAFAAPVANVTIAFAVASGGGTLSSPTATTNALGQASVSLTPVLGVNTVTATEADLGATVTFTANGLIPGAPTLTASSGDGQTGTVGAGLAKPLVVKITNADGTPAAGIAVTFAATSGGGSVTPATALTAADGTASSALTLGHGAGSNLVEARAAGVNDSPATFTETARAGAADHLVVSSGNGQSGSTGTLLGNPLVVTCADAYGNPVAGNKVSFATSSGSVSPASMVTNASGAASTNLTLAAAPGTATVTATGTALPKGPVTFTETGTTPVPRFYVQDVAPVLAAHCTSCHGPGGTQSGAPLDGFAAVVSGTTHYAHVPAAYVVPGNPAGSLVLAKIRGVAQAGGIMPPAGYGTLTAAQVQIVNDWIAGGALQSSSGPATAIALTSGNNQSMAAGEKLAAPLVVTVSDAKGNPVAGYTVTFAVASGGGVVLATSAMTDGNGLAETQLILGPAPGTNTATATAGSLGSVTFTATGTATTYSGEPLTSSTNPLDQAALVALRGAGVEPAPISSDTEFLRRVTADVAGRLPTEAEMTTFLADATPNKRATTIDTLLASTDYANHWGVDILGAWACVTTGSTTFNAALVADVANDVPLSTLVHSFCTGTGTEGTLFDQQFPGNGGNDAVDQIMIAFTGMTSQCARCHDHHLTVPGQDDPMWVQDDNYGLYAFLAPSPTYATKLTPAGSRFGSPVQPHWVGDGYASTIIPSVTLASPLAARRSAFGDILVASNVFARGTAHRIFAEVMDPLLDPNQFLAANLAAVQQPQLLDALRAQFQSQGTQLRGFLRLILNSQLYQLTTKGSTTANDALLARRTVRRHHSEVIEQGFSSTSGVPWVTNSFIQDNFGYPRLRVSIYDRTDAINLGQAFILMNSTAATSGKVTVSTATIQTLAAQVSGTKTPVLTRAQAVTTLFHLALTRDPTPTELTGVLAAVSSQTSNLNALEDVAVGLCASDEFVSR